MRRHRYQPYLILLFAVFIIAMAPKTLQNVLRHQFLRPIFPLNRVFAHRQNPQLKIPKIAQAPKPTYHPFYQSAQVAKILYRNPAYWNSFFWIDRGKKNCDDPANLTLNSPVLYQNALIGVVDYIGKYQSRVKLITSSQLTVSVRVLRGKDQYFDLLKHLNGLLSYRCIQSNVRLSEELEIIRDQIAHQKENHYLAKGEITGLSLPLWRKDSLILKGKGFNCSTPDHLSVARDLFSGIPLEGGGEKMPLIERDDLLITTGFDGIFPEGLVVAKVNSVDAIRPGEYFYSLTATPIIQNLDDLTHVEILPPLQFQSESLSEYGGYIFKKTAN